MGGKAPSDDGDSPTSVLDEAEAAQQHAQDVLAFDENPGPWKRTPHPDQDHQRAGRLQAPVQRAPTLPPASQSCLPWGMPVKDCKSLLII
jgi:hypothetical protein